MNNDIQGKINIKIEKEKKVVRLMIIKYCKGHKHLNPPCKDCSNLMHYVETRVDLCPFMESKTYCNNCKMHCFRRDMRERIKVMMRYSGPRMIFSNPIIAIDHLYQDIKNRLK